MTARFVLGLMLTSGPVEGVGACRAAGYFGFIEVFADDAVRDVRPSFRYGRQVGIAQCDFGVAAVDVIEVVAGTRRSGRDGRERNVRLGGHRLLLWLMADQ
jgi:hypothetical protein